MKFSVITFGCSFNQHDTELMIDSLRTTYTYTSAPAKANLVIINTCTVKNLAETKAFKTLRYYQEQGKYIIVAGCIPQAEPSYLSTFLKNVSVLGTNDIDKIKEVVEKTFKGETVHHLTDLKSKNLPARKEPTSFRLNYITAIIPINEGCTNLCTYCKTKAARGNLQSYTVKDIKKKIECYLEQGVKEIWLTSQDTAAYGLDIGTNLNELLQDILSIKKDFWLRIGMGNPNHFKRIFPSFLENLKDPRVFKFLHIPVQTGSNRLLREMRRGNTKEDYLWLIRQATKKFPWITISNDIIVAYPTETIEELEETAEVLRETRPSVLNLSRFWLRKGTAAENYNKKDFIDGQDSKRRSKYIREIFDEIALENNRSWIGWEGKILINEKGKGETSMGRNIYYKPVIVPGDYEIGTELNVKVKDATKHDLRAELN